MKQENVKVNVLDINGNELPSTMRNGKVRKLLKEKRAKVVNKDPFTIQLLYEVTENDEDYEIDVELSNWMSEYANNLFDKIINFENKVKEIVPFHSYWETDKNKDSSIVKLKALLLKHYDDFSNDDKYSEWEKASGKYYNTFLVLESISSCAQHEKDHDSNNWHYGFPTFITEFIEFTMNKVPYGQKQYNNTMKYLRDAIYVVDCEERDAFSKFFGENYKTLVLLLKQLEVDISKCYPYYLELLRVYEPLNIIVTDRNTVPKFTNYKSIRLICEDFESIVSTLEQYEYNGEYGEEEFYRRLFNQSNIFIDFASYCKDTTSRMVPFGLGMDMLFYRFNTDTDFTNARYRDDEIVFNFVPNNPCIFDIKDSMTVDEMYKANKYIVPDKRIMCEDPYNYCSKYGEHFFDGAPRQLTEDDVFEADYTIHQKEIVFDYNNIVEEKWWSDSDIAQKAYDKLNKQAKKLAEIEFANENMVEVETELFRAKEFYDFCLKNDCKNCYALYYHRANGGLLSFDRRTKRFEQRIIKKHNYQSEWDKYNFELLTELYYLDDKNNKLVSIKKYDEYVITKNYKRYKDNLHISPEAIVENLKHYKEIIDNKTPIENTLLSISDYYYAKKHEELSEDILVTIKELYDYIKANGLEYNIYVVLD